MAEKIKGVKTVAFVASNREGVGRFVTRTSEDWQVSEEITEADLTTGLVGAISRKAVQLLAVLQEIGIVAIEVWEVRQDEDEETPPTLVNQRPLFTIKQPELSDGKKS